MSEPLQQGASSAGEVSRLTEHLFRQESGKLVAVLTGMFGIERLHFVEDVVQEALVKALKTWPYYGIPDNPAAWLTQAAKNRALDLIRREKRFREKQDQIALTLEQWPADATGGRPVRFDSEIQDDRLRLMFACCHPAIPPESQTVLALKTLCGLGPTEIARAFLSTEAAINKRLTRARRTLRQQQIPFEIPAAAEIDGRIDAVLQTLYLLFNEGYKASGGDAVVREDLFAEAIRLAIALAEHPTGDRPRTHALIALMLFSGARLSGRMDVNGNILILKDQDRSCWDRSMIARALYHLELSGDGDELSTFHLQAAIAACHCTAPDYETTNWRQILSLYDRLVAIDPSPVVALNRAVALAKVQGPTAGIAALDRIGDRRRLQSYYLFHAVRAEFEAEQGKVAAAAAHLRKALPLAGLNAERALLSERLSRLEVEVPNVR